MVALSVPGENAVDSLAYPLVEAVVDQGRMARVVQSGDETSVNPIGSSNWRRDRIPASLLIRVGRGSTTIGRPGRKSKRIRSAVCSTIHDLLVCVNWRHTRNLTRKEVVK